MAKIKSAEDLHKNVPPDWYWRSIYKDRNILQRYVHGKRFREVGEMIEPTGGRVLDIGSADGVFTKVILDKSKAKEIIGIDVLRTSVLWARKHWKKNKKMKFFVGDAHKLNFESNSFDAVVALEVLEHVHKPLLVLKEIKRVLKKGGYVVVLVPTENTLFNFVWFFWTKTRGKIWKDTHLHNYKENYLVNLCNKVGLTVEEDKKFIYGALQAVKARKK